MSELIEALEETIEIWEWLRNCPTCNDKRNAYDALGYSLTDLNDCPCCQYTIRNNIPYPFILEPDDIDYSLCPECSQCPIQWTKDYSNCKAVFCEEDGSPYLLWYNAKVESEREIGAEGVLILARKALKEAKNDLKM